MKFLFLTCLFIVISAVNAFCDDGVNITQPSTDSSISGRIMIKNKTPMNTGIILLYNGASGPPPAMGQYWRIPDMILGTDSNGRFSVSLPPGIYYMQAAQKKPDGKIGPPKENEFFYFHGDSQGNAYPLTVKAGTNLDLGVLTGTFIFTLDMVKRGKGVTAVEGIVTDMENNPIEGVYIFAHLTRNTQGRPIFISDKTDKNGKYLLRVYPGTYYLSVRGVIGGGPPEAGELQSVTKEFEPRMVTLIKSEKLKDIVLKVGRFSGKGSTGVDKPEKVWKKIGDIQGQ